MTKPIRPAPVNRELYIRFGNKCRRQDKEISDVLTKLIEVYLKKGDTLFKR